MSGEIQPRESSLAAKPIRRGIRSHGAFFNRAGFDQGACTTGSLATKPGGLRRWPIDPIVPRVARIIMRAGEGCARSSPMSPAYLGRRRAHREHRQSR
jgi:hypothetical protein